MGVIEQVWQSIEVYTTDADDVSASRVLLRLSGAELVVRGDLREQPRGLRAATRNVEIPSGKPLSLSVVRLDAMGEAVAVFTRSLCASDAVARNRRVIEQGRVGLVSVISKNANVFTATSAEDLGAVVAALSSEFGVTEGSILLSCTGVIGVTLPRAAVVERIPGLAAELSEAKLGDVAEAILTTDRRPKVASLRYGDVVLSGMIKGAGMIEPNLATMLCFIYTNAGVERALFDGILRRVAERTFNCLSVDGDTSTSDTVALISTGERPLAANELADFETALSALCLKLARDVAFEAEGATKLLEVTVATDTTPEEARVFAKSIVNSPLVKAAVNGADPNWGRVVMAIGKAARVLPGHAVVPRSAVAIRMMGRLLFDRGRAVEVDLDGLRALMREKTRVTIGVEIGEPRFVSKVWGCDLSDEYVRENASYTS